MTDRALQIGFSQRIRLEWLEKTANLVLGGSKKSAVLSSLQDMLRDKLSVGGDAERGNREKAITILMKIWDIVPPDQIRLRDTGLELLRELPSYEHIAVHWGMATAVYPFFGIVAAAAGRLLQLQETASAAQVQRRVREKYGERATVARAARRVLRTFVDWGVLKDGPEAGVYVRGKVHPISSLRVAAWLVAALLHASPTGTSSLKAVLDSPALFPLSMQRVPSEALAAAGQIDIIRHGLDDDLVMLRKPANSFRAREIPG